MILNAQKYAESTVSFERCQDIFDYCADLPVTTTAPEEILKIVLSLEQRRRSQSEFAREQELFWMHQICTQTHKYIYLCMCLFIYIAYIYIYIYTYGTYVIIYIYIYILYILYIYYIYALYIYIFYIYYIYALYIQYI